MNTFSLPNKGDYPVFFETYISKLSQENYSDLIQKQLEELKSYFSTKPDGWEDRGYAEGKWTPKEVLGHIIDTERIMLFRALCIARGEKQLLPGFDQDQYVVEGRFASVSFSALIKDFEMQRQALLSFIPTLSEEVLDWVGSANGNPISPRALLWIIPGHLEHHLRIFKERY